MNRPISPCNPGGVHDCELRKVGCRSTCEKWQKFEAEKIAFSESLRKNGNNDMGSYAMDRIIKLHYKSFWRHKKEGR